MPVPPNKRKLKEIDASLVESGRLNIGIPCVPIEIQRQFKGKVKVIQAHSCKFSLVGIRKCLLNKHQHLWASTRKPGFDPFLVFFSTRIFVKCDNDF